MHRRWTSWLCLAALAGCEAELSSTEADPGAPMPEATPGEVFVPGTSDDPAQPPPIDDEPDPEVEGEALPPFAPAPPRLHRLTRGQYVASLHHLLGAVDVPDDLEDDTPLHGFTTIGASELAISPHAAEQFEAAANEVATQVFAVADRRAELVGCAPDAPGCLEGFLARFGRRAWRRPISPDELTTLTRVSRELGERLGDPWQGVEKVVSAMLQSPYFLFRVERGEVDPDDPTRRRYTDWEMAARLSFLLWNAPPDDALLDAAARGELTDDEGLRAQAERLLDDARARAAVRRFFGEYFTLERLDTMTKDPEVFPQMSPALVEAMREEVLGVIEHLVFERDASFLDLLDTRTTFVDDALAALYALPPPEAPGMRRVELPDDSPRGGLMGMAAILALNAHATVTSPTLRGKFIQANLRCFDVPPPPPGVTTSLPEPEDGRPRTVREKLEAHRADPTCNGCHQFMDPMGIGLENFDAIGAWRTTDNGLPVDARSALRGVPFEGARELGALLRDDPAVAECVARRLYRYGTGHLEETHEEAAIAELDAAFADSGHRFRALLLGLVMSEGFRTASLEDAQVPEAGAEEEGE